MNDKSKKVAQVAFGLAVDGPFDYSIPQDLLGKVCVGQRVWVSLNKQKRVGFVVGLIPRSRFPRLNPILELLDDNPSLDSRQIALAKKISGHYGCSLGEAFEACLPAILRRKTRFDPGGSAGAIPFEEKRDARFILGIVQNEKKYWEFLLEKITETLGNRLSVILLVPDFMRLQQVEKMLKDSSLGPLYVFDHRLKDREELDVWAKGRLAEPQVILGMRSAVFIPVHRLGLIILDEEENDAYKQEQSPHYHAGQVARWRAEAEGCQAMFMSRSPSAEMWHRAKKEHWSLQEPGGEAPVVTKVIDLTNYNPKKSSLVSFPLQNEIQQSLIHGKKILLLFNRRGFATMTHCQDCGFVMKCTRCDSKMVYLYAKKNLVCPHCRSNTELPKFCPKCKASYLRSVGMGVEKLESDLARFYPQARIAHFDRDTVQLDQNAQIMIATQAILRQLPERAFELVALLNADAQLNVNDFRSAAKTFTLLMNLRAVASEKFFVQTKLADNYCLKAIRRSEPDAFYRMELKLRRQIGLPPYTHLIEVGVRGPKEKETFEFGLLLYNELKKSPARSVEVLELHPEMLPKLRDKYRYQIIVKCKNVRTGVLIIKKALKSFRKRSGVVVAVNVDP